MYRKILIAYNGTPESRSAIHECIGLAPDPSSEIHLLAVMDNPAPPIIGDYGSVDPYDADAEMAATKQKMDGELMQGHTLLKNAGLNAITHLEVGQPVDVISDLADTLGIELVIVGHSRHRSWATRWWRGSTDAALIEKVSCTLMIAPGPRE